MVLENDRDIRDPLFEESHRPAPHRQHRADRTAIDAIWMQTHRRRFVRDALEPNPLIRTAQAVFVRARGWSLIRLRRAHAPTPSSNPESQATFIQSSPGLAPMTTRT